MKFRALLADGSAMKEFMNVVTSVSKMSKDCVMRIASDRLYLIVSDDEGGGPRQPLMWCEMPSRHYFREYNMLGVSPDHNEIYLEFMPVMLAKSLASVRQSAKSLKIKLTHKHTPCLTLELDMCSEGYQSRQCIHDVPVQVVPRRQWADYHEPKPANYHVSLQMPVLRHVRNIVERMKNMSHNLAVSADRAGRLTLHIDSAMVAISAHFPGLDVLSFDSGTDTDRPVSACVDIKKLFMLLTSLQAASYPVSCSIVHQSMVRLQLCQPNGLRIQCFLAHAAD